MSTVSAAFFVFAYLCLRGIILRWRANVVEEEYRYHSKIKASADKIMENLRPFYVGEYVPTALEATQAIETAYGSAVDIMYADIMYAAEREADKLEPELYRQVAKFFFFAAAGAAGYTITALFY